jgi:hypothetical protein
MKIRNSVEGKIYVYSVLSDDYYIIDPDEGYRVSGYGFQHFLCSKKQINPINIE